MLTRIGIFALFLFLLFPAGCFRNSSKEEKTITKGNSLIIKGVIDRAAGEEILLEEMGAREFIPVDTVICDNSGAFEISFDSENVAFYVLRYGKTSYVTLLMEPGESLVFSGTVGKKDLYSVKGSLGSELLQVLAFEHKTTLNALSEITRKNMEYASLPDYPVLKQVFDHQFDSITTQFRDYSLRYIQDNAGSLVILVALYNLYGQGLPVFHPETDLQIYQYVDSALMVNFSEFEAVQLLHAQLTEAAQLNLDHQQAEKVLKGEIAPDFVSSRPDGSQFALSDLRGNYVLLSFWAAWSHLCREENLTLQKAFEVYGEMGLKILQVSFDDDRKIWTEAIKEDRLSWDHVSELRRWESPVADLYHVEKIPGNVLIDPAGRVIETNLFGTQLMNKLELIFSK